MCYNLDFPVAHNGIRTMIISGYNPILNRNICNVNKFMIVLYPRTIYVQYKKILLSIFGEGHLCEL